MAQRRPLVLVNGKTVELPQVDTLPGGGAGGAIMQLVTVNVPYSSREETSVIVATPGITAGSRIMCNLAGTTADDENELDDLSDLSVRVNPTLDSLEFLFACPGVFGGPVKILYLVGA